MKYKNMLEAYDALNTKFDLIYSDPAVNQSDENNYVDLLYHEILTKYKVLGMGSKFNRFQYIFINFKVLTGKKVLVHHHWLECNSFKSILLIIYKLSFLSIFKLLGGTLIWTIHNEYPHSRKFMALNKLTQKIMGHISTKNHVHCAKAITIMSNNLNIPRNKFFVVKHPDYKAEVMDKDNALEIFLNKYAKDKLNTTVFLLFGQIAEYKGIEELLEIFNNMQGDFTLMIAGKIKIGNNDFFKKILEYKENKKIIFINNFIPDEDIPIFFNLADYTIYNYKNILTSGSVILSLNYNVKTIAINKGCISEIQDDNLIVYKNHDELIDILEQVLG